MSEWKNAAVWEFMPSHLRQPMTRFIDEGINPGDFLQAFLSNDLFGALVHADFASRRRLQDIASFIDSFAPAVCWGNKMAFDNWIEIGGLSGYQKLHRQEAA